MMRTGTFVLIVLFLITMVFLWNMVGFTDTFLKSFNSTSTQNPLDFTQLNQVLVWFPIIFMVGFIGYALMRFMSETSYGEEVLYEREDTETEEPDEPTDPTLETETPKAELVIYKCPRCGADIDFEEDHTKTKCAYCGAHVHRNMNHQWNSEGDDDEE